MLNRLACCINLFPPSDLRPMVDKKRLFPLNILGVLSIQHKCWILFLKDAATFHLCLVYHLQMRFLGLPSSVKWPPMPSAGTVLRWGREEAWDRWENLEITRGARLECLELTSRSQTRVPACFSPCCSVPKYVFCFDAMGFFLFKFFLLRKQGDLSRLEAVINLYVCF